MRFNCQGRVAALSTSLPPFLRQRQDRRLSTLHRSRGQKPVLLDSCYRLLNRFRSPIYHLKISEFSGQTPLGVLPSLDGYFSLCLVLMVDGGLSAASVKRRFPADGIAPAILRRTRRCDH